MLYGCINLKKITLLKTLFILGLVTFQTFYLGVNNSGANETYWDDQWSYMQEVIVPFDTSIRAAEFQPIDIFVQFENPCWVNNEDEYSIRVICEKESESLELESQIYNLEFSDNEHISACNLVFLLPENMNGQERYLIYYDDSAKPNPEYQDHVSIGES